MCINDTLGRLSSFSHAVNDELLKSSGLYEFVRKDSEGRYFWDVNFIDRLDNYLAKNIHDFDLSPAEFQAFKAFLDYEDSQIAQAVVTDNKQESLDRLFYKTSIGGEHGNI